MPPPTKRTQKKRPFREYCDKYLNVNFIKSLALDPARLPIVSYLILAAEVFLNIFIVWRINYTEIDWKAYMQECEGFLNGTTDYSQLKGEFTEQNMRPRSNYFHA